MILLVAFCICVTHPFNRVSLMVVSTACTAEDDRKGLGLGLFIGSIFLLS